MKNFQNFLAKDFKDQCIGTKSENKNTINKYRNFFESNFVGVKKLFVLICSNQDNNSKKYKATRYDLPKGIIENYNVIINGKKIS